MEITKVVKPFIRTQYFWQYSVCKLLSFKAHFYVLKRTLNTIKCTSFLQGLLADSATRTLTVPSGTLFHTENFSRKC